MFVLFFSLFWIMWNEINLRKIWTMQVGMSWTAAWKYTMLMFTNRLISIELELKIQKL